MRAEEREAKHRQMDGGEDQREAGTGGQA
jgi:hypothetical protein